MLVKLTDQGQLKRPHLELIFRSTTLGIRDSLKLI